ncbi:MAG: DUF4402 domain-containing protein [Alphaproteobacteria bacterium]|nr:DUF4402 domain-containing protein [Alphaproteobacteria bacterium]
MDYLKNSQPWIAALILLAMVFASSVTQAQTVAVVTAPDLGKVTAASNGVTVFNFAAGTGEVTRVSGSGTRAAAGAAYATVVVTCGSAASNEGDGEFGQNTQGGDTQGGGSEGGDGQRRDGSGREHQGGGWCDRDPLKITVTNAGSPTGRAGPLGAFTAAMGNAVLVSGSPSTPANPLVFEIQGLGGTSRSFSIGADFPIYGDDRSDLPTGLATSGFVVTMEDGKRSHGSFSGPGIGAAYVIHQLKMAVASDPNTGAPMRLDFGRIVLPTSGPANVNLSASTGERTVTGAGALANPAPQRGGFVVEGQRGESISVSVPPSITLTNTSGQGSLAISTNTTAVGVATLSVGTGASGSYTFYVGGSFALSPTTPSGAYQGSYTVSANYD